ncbi:hypothetical protein [Natrinema sp. H-ect4]|uniref:hypothetical protein n=1 Tax=Natrinema sp. H-ect4 TaxID=3242699 RepID=UPI0035A86DAA
MCEIQVSRGSAIAEELERAIDRKEPVTIDPTDGKTANVRKRVICGWKVST